MKNTITRTLTETHYTAVVANLKDGVICEGLGTVQGNLTAEALLKREQKTDSDTMKTVAIKDIQTVDRTYEMSLETFRQNAWQVQKRSSPSSITRTLAVTQYDVLIADLEEQTVRTEHREVIGEVGNSQALVKALQKEDTDTQKTVAVNITGTEVQLYEMSEQEFISLAKMAN